MGRLVPVAGLGHTVVESDLLAQGSCIGDRCLAGLVARLGFVGATHLAHQIDVFPLNDIRRLPLRVLFG